MATIVNATPNTVFQGVQDLSTRQLLPAPIPVPTHLPKVYIFAKKGPSTPQLVSGASLADMYDAESFDLRKPWATHQTVLANLVNGQGNALMVERVIPKDAPAPATLRVFLDVLKTTLPVYNRNSDGSIATDAAGQPVPSGQTAVGYIAKWVTGKTVDALGADNYGSGTQAAGDQTDAAGAQSIRYPIMDLVVPDQGEYGNNIALAMWAATVNSNIALDARPLVDEMVYPFRMAVLSRKDAKSTPTVVQTLGAEQFVNVTFKPNTIDKNTDSLLSMHNVFIDAYQAINNPKVPRKYGPFTSMHVYDDNINTLLTEFVAAELPYLNGFSDLTGAAGEQYRFNMISGVTSHGVPYTAFKINNVDGNAVYLTANTPMYASGGGDGTLNETVFADLVTERVVQYADVNSYLQNTARYPESILYDTGFPLNTKYAMCSFIAVRKDTAVVLSTHDVLGPQLTASQESSLAIALKAHLQMYPESEYYGTATVRGVIVGRSGTLLNSQYTKPLPLTMELATKAAAYMGAANGKWKPGLAMDSDPNNMVTMFSNVNVTFTPVTVRNKDWANGLVWVESYDIESLYFPALKTVYDNDTSVLNSFFTMMACVELEKIGDRARRTYSGNSQLTDAQIVDRVNNFIATQSNGKFDGRFVIKPNTFYTAADKARGYSYQIQINIYANNMKTVGVLSIAAYRMSDLTAKP